MSQIDEPPAGREASVPVGTTPATRPGDSHPPETRSTAISATGATGVAGATGATVTTPATVVTSAEPPAARRAVAGSPPAGSTAATANANGPATAPLATVAGRPLTPSTGTRVVDDQGSERTGGPAVPARRAITLILLTLLGLLVVDGHGMVRAGRNMNPGWPRTLVLGLGRPADQIARDTGLDLPRRLLYAAFNHNDSPGGSSELLSPSAGAAGPAPAAGPAKGPGTPAGAPAGSSASNRAVVHPSPSATLPPLRRPSVAAPLRLLVTGDSMTNPLGPPLIELAHGTVRADVDTHYSTGLVRPDFFDWAANAHKQIAADHPEAVLLTLGANDGQGFTMPNGDIYSAGSPAWVTEYTRRAVILLRIYSQGGRVPIYWMSLPIARSAKLDGYFRQLNAAIAAATRVVPRTHLVNIRDRLADHGSYSAYLTDDSGHKILARDSDGVHMTIDGSRLAARILLKVIDTEWGIAPR
ncbi:MAG: DUF459 domain-containing protein [Frankia sp.]